MHFGTPLRYFYSTENTAWVYAVNPKGDKFMWKYVLKRLVLLIPILIGVTLIVFTIMNVKPGDPGRTALGLSASQEAVDKYNESLGINQPFFTRYFDYMSDMFHGSLGQSWYGGEDVLSGIVNRFPITLRICIIAIILALAVGIPLGVLCAVFQYSPMDRIITPLSMVLSSFPSFWLCMLMSLLFAVKLKWVPVYGIDNWKSYILPVIVCSSNVLAMTTRLTRSTMLEVIRQDYIRTARAKGAKEKSIIFEHALGNSLIPVVTNAGLSVSGMLGGSVLIESVFAIPGMGTYIVEAVNSKDIPVVMGCVVVFATSTVLINLAVDLLYAFLDPRIKAKFTSTGKKKHNKVKEAANEA